MDAKRVKMGIVVAFFLLLVALAFLVVRPFLASLVASCIFAYLFYPVYRWLNARLKRPSLSAFLVTLLLILIMLVPLVVVANVLITETLVLYRSDIPGKITQAVAGWFAEDSLLTAGVGDMVRKGVSYVATVATDFAIALPARMLDVVVFVYVFFHLLLVGEVVLGRVKAMIPLRNKEKLVQHIGGTTYAIVYGLFLVALVEFVIAVIGLSVLRVGAPFLWALLIFLAALLPFVGPSLILVPLMAYKVVQGNVLMVIGLAIMWLVLFYVDTIVRAKIISDRAKMHPVVMLLGIIGGVGVFGAVGLILGPLVLSFLTVIVEDYYYDLLKAE